MPSRRDLLFGFLRRKPEKSEIDSEKGSLPPSDFDNERITRRQFNQAAATLVATSSVSGSISAAAFPPIAKEASAALPDDWSQMTDLIINYFDLETQLEKPILALCKKAKEINEATDFLDLLNDHPALIDSSRELLENAKNKAKEIEEFFEKKCSADIKRAFHLATETPPDYQLAKAEKAYGAIVKSVKLHAKKSIEKQSIEKVVEDIHLSQPISIKVHIAKHNSNRFDITIPGTMDHADKIATLTKFRANIETDHPGVRISEKPSHQERLVILDPPKKLRRTLLEMAEKAQDNNAMSARF